MREIVFAGIYALSASTSLAQTTTSPQPAAPVVGAPTDQAAASQQGGPANLCQELLAFMKAPPEPEAPAGAAKPATATAAASKAAPAQQSPAPDQPSGSSQKGSAALAGTTAAGARQGATSKPDAGSNSAQAVTGQSGVATDAPDPTKDKAVSGSVANAPQKETRAAPTPPADVTSTPRESILTVEAAEQLANANDIAQCQKMAREMRVSGVAMPPPLIALGALDLKYQQKPRAPAQPSAPATGGQGAPQAPAPQ